MALRGRGLLRVQGPRTSRAARLREGARMKRAFRRPDFVTAEMLERARQAIRDTDGVLQVTTDALRAAINAAVSERLRDSVALLAVLLMQQRQALRDAEEVQPMFRRTL